MSTESKVGAIHDFSTIVEKVEQKAHVRRTILIWLRYDVLSKTKSAN